MTESTYDLFEHGDVVAEYASFDFIFGAEQLLVDELRRRDRPGAVLDLGVGGGRTTEPLAAVARTYVGVDVSLPMVEACRARFADRGELPVTFVAADARQLPFADASFEAVLFSFNGLDVVGGQDARRAVLDELRRVAAPASVVWFSSSNLLFAVEQLSARTVLPHGWRELHPRSLLRRARRLRRMRRLNLPLRALRRAPSATIVEERHRYELHPERFAAPRERVRVGRFHVRPSVQVEQLRAAGFGAVRLFAPDGEEVTGSSDAQLAGRPWLQYATTVGGTGWAG